MYGPWETAARSSTGTGSSGRPFPAEPHGTLKVSVAQVQDNVWAVGGNWLSDDPNATALHWDGISWAKGCRFPQCMS